MKYILILILFLLHYHLISFAIHNLKGKNKVAALGTIMINLIVLAMQVALYFVDI